MEKAHGYTYVRTKTVQRAGKNPNHMPPKAPKRGHAPKRARHNPPSPPSRAPPPSVEGTPVVPSAEYDSVYSSPAYGPDSFSPETIKEPSPEPDFAGIMFPPPPSQRLPSPVSIEPAVILQMQQNHHQQQQHPAYDPGHFQGPSGVLQAAGLQNDSGFGVVYDPVPSHWDALPARVDPILSSESPEYDNFPRDAPSALFEPPGIDPQLPVVPNTYYKPERDRDLSV